MDLRSPSGAFDRRRIRSQPVLADDLRLLLGRRRLAVGALAVVLVAVGAGAWLLGGTARVSLAVAAGADPRREVAALVGFVVSLAATALAWRRAFASVGVEVSGLTASAYYGAGSVVNTLSPGRIGDAVRAALYGRLLPRERGRIVTSAGALGAVALSRGLVHAIVIGVAASLGLVPVWPALLLAGAGVAGLGIVWLLRRRRLGRHVDRLTGAVRTMIQRPRLGAGVVGWSALAVSGRLLAAASVASALGVRSPILAALVITAALDVASAFPVTPGGAGLTSGAVALALVGRGTGTADAVAAGLVFHVVETMATAVFVAVSTPLAARPEFARRAAVRVGAAMAVAAALAAVGAAVVSFDLT